MGRLRVTARQRRRLAGELEGCRIPFARIERVVNQRAYSHTLALELLALARGATGAGWWERHLSALLLEHLALKIPEGQVDAWRRLLDGLGQMENGHLRTSVLQEGFTTTELAPFTREFARYLARNEALHRQLEQARSPSLAVRRLLHLSRQSCRVLLARYTFSPEEVVQRFLDSVRVSRGVPSTFLDLNRLAREAAERSLARLPRFEAEIVRSILDRGEIFWTSERPDRSLNALIEYPLTTSSLVLKPPGSTLELEFKRSGHSRHLTLQLSFGGDVPGHHRLNGGAYGSGLEWEATAAARAACSYRAAHGQELAISIPVEVQLVHTVPVGERQVYIMSYFTDPSVFGAEYEQMRATLRSVVAANKREYGWRLPHATDDLGLTNEFLIQTKPTQGILLGSSSFRIDKVAMYLTAPGVRQYLRAVAGNERSPIAGRLVVDAVLAEALGSYRPPAVRPEGLEDYIEAALREPVNRKRADLVYRGLLSQAARFWGTLLAWGAGSRGESTVARNVGLRSVWQAARWSVRLVFMDHDQLKFYGGDPDGFSPLRTLPVIQLDERYLVRRSPGPPTPSDGSVLSLLELIYRVSPDQRKRGRALFRKELAAAYRRTRRHQLSGERLEGFPERRFIDSLEAWDETVALCLRARERGIEHWRRSVKRSLADRGREVQRLDDFLAAFERHERFLRRYRFLYLSPDDSPGSCCEAVCT